MERKAIFIPHKSMKSISLAVLLMLSVPAIAQTFDTYYDSHWKATDASNASFYSRLQKTDSGWHRKDYFVHGGSLQMDGYFADSACKVKSGPFVYFFPNKKVDAFGRYLNNKKQGMWLQFYSNGMMMDSTVYESGNPIGGSMGWHRNGVTSDSSYWNPDGSGVQVDWFSNGNPSFAGRYGPGMKQQGKWQYFHSNGKLSSIELYDQGVLVDKNYFDEDGNPVTDTTNNDQAASFPGGTDAWSKYIYAHAYFPDQYKITNAEQVTVEVTAMIDESGNVVDVEISLPFHPDFDKIALKAFKGAPKWIPARKHNRAVTQYISQAMTFHNAEEN